MKANDILSKALGHLSDRAVTYDNQQGERSMAKTVAAINAIYDLGMTEVQGWHFMEILKIVRSSQGAFKADNFEDGAAYAALAGEAAYSSNSAKSDEENHDESEMPYRIMPDAPKWANFAFSNNGIRTVYCEKRPFCANEGFANPFWIADASGRHDDIVNYPDQFEARRVYRSQEEADKANGKSAG